MKKTPIQKLAEKNKKNVERMREGQKETDDLMEKIRSGEMTAGQAFLEKGRLAKERRKSK